MKAPTNVIGPDGSLCQRGEEIPAAWFDVMTDLADHLAAIPEPPEDAPAPRTPRPPATAGRAPAKKVAAAAKIGRERGTE